MNKNHKLVVALGLVLLLSGCVKSSEMQCRVLCSEHNMSYERVSASLMFDTGDKLVNCYCTKVLEVRSYETKD